MELDHYSTGGPSEVTEEARRVRQTGLSGWMTPEAAHDPFVMAAVAAAAAPEMVIGTAVAVAFARSPMVTAAAAWDLARMTSGRFLLGLGTQIRAHVVHRFAAPWSDPVGRMRDYVGALRAIWAAWSGRARLRYRSRHYTLSLMTPFFDPGPLPGVETVPIYLAGVGPAMARLAGEVADGFHVHPFHHVPYLDEILLPRLHAGRAAGPFPERPMELASSVFCITGRGESEMTSARELVRRQIAFYASTPSYHGVLEHGGWDIGPRLLERSRLGEWDEMARLVPDDLVDAVAVTAEPDRIGEAIVARYGRRLARVGLYGVGLDALSPESWRRIVVALG